MGPHARTLLVARPVECLAFLFLSLIFITASLIYLSENGGSSYLDALFTAFSAATVTGLTVVETSSLSLASQGAILLAMQFGGLSIYIGAYLILTVAGMRGKSAAERLAQINWKDVRTILIFSFFVEALAAVGYFFIFRDTMSVWGAAHYAVFHSVSAYCNAGFFLFPDNFHSASPFIAGIAMAEIVLGGLGFILLTDLRDKIWAFLRGRRGPYFRLESRIMIFSTLLLVLAGFLGFWALEFRGVLEETGLGKSALASLFLSVNARTAGFSAVELSELHNASYLMIMFLMFVGAGSGSMAGGVKITTIAIVLLATLSSLRGKSQVKLYGSQIPPENLYRSRSVLIWYGIILFTLSFMLLASEDAIAFRDILFESFSAMGTVGLSTGITAQLSAIGKIIIMALMFAGRLSPLVLTYMFSNAMSAKGDPYAHKEVINIG